VDAERDVAAPPPPAQIESLGRALVGAMRSGGVSELDVAFGSVSIRLRAEAGCAPTADGLARPPAELPPPVESTAADFITAPMVGTFYASPSPGSPPFVEAGDAIKPGQVIGIIEAMKIMNEISADRPGVVDAVLATNGQAVEYGSPLLRLRRAG
jgi:acetyl-CoA carboxylase biotin carboxyl carrier protein